MDSSGNFIISWSSNNEDGSGRGIYAQRYAPSGSAIGSEFKVNTYTSGHQDRSTIAIDGSGNFVISWTSDGQDNGGSFGIYAQRYFANGIANGGEFLVNTTTSGDQQNPSAAMSSSGALIIAWDGNGPGDSKGIFWQSYSSGNTPPVANTDTAITNEDTPVSSVAPGVLINDTDPDVGAVLTVTGIYAGTSGISTTVIAGGVSVTGVYGNLLIRQDGSYTYTPNATTAQALATGQVVTDIFTYTIEDNLNANSSSTLTVTINGLNDAPVGNADSYAVDKLGILNITTAGVLNNDTDVDTNPVPDTLTVTLVNGSAPNVGSPLVGMYGTLTLNANGSLNYTPDTGNPTVNGLTPGSSVVDNFTYQVSDGKGGTSSTTLSITISGSNTAPVATNDSYITYEDTALSIPSAGVISNDTDTESNVLSASLVSTVSNGSLVFSSNGSFTYTPNANFNGNDSFTYQVSDGSLSSNIATVNLTITPVNDDPQAISDIGAVNQDGTLNVNAASGVLSNDTDVDIGDTRAVNLIATGSDSSTVVLGTPGSLTSTYGTLTLYSDGSYSYVANGASSKSLGVGDTSEDIFTYTMQDAAGAASDATLTITITGSNDVPTITGTTAVTNINDTATATPFSAVTIGDVDSPAQPLSISITLDLAAKGTFSNLGGGAYNAGIYTFSGTAAASTTAVQGLIFTPTANRVSPGSTETTIFTISVSDGIAAPATNNATTVVTTSVNDAPLAVADTAIAVEAGGVTNGTAGSNPSGNVLTNDTDVDTSDTKTVTTTGVNVGTYGTLTLNSDGSYSYVVDNNNAMVQALRTSSDTLTELFNYTMQDTVGATSSSTLSITITGSNDTPVGVADTDSINEDATITKTAPSGVLSNDTDVDSGDTKTVSAFAFGATPGTIGNELNGTYGRLTLNADGSYTYIADLPAAQTLKAGQVVSEVFSYTTKDTVGDTSATTITFTITGVNDAAVISSGTGNVTEDLSLTDNGTLTITDVDSGESSFNIQPGSVGNYGTFTINTIGNWTYTLDNSKTAVQALAPGNTLIDTFTVTSLDGTTSSVTLTINGNNDKPVANSSTGSGDQNTTTPIAVTLSASDIDGTITSFKLSSLPANGIIYLDPAMTSPVAVNSALAAASNALTLYFKPAKDWSGTTTFNYLAVDDFGTDSAAATVSVTVASTPPPTVEIVTVATTPPPPPTSTSNTTELSNAASTVAKSAETTSAVPAKPAPVFVPTTNTGTPDYTGNIIEEKPATQESHSENTAQNENQPVLRVDAINAVYGDLKLDALMLAEFVNGKQSELSLFQITSSATENHAFLQGLDQLRNDLQSESHVEKQVIGASIAAGTGLSIGYVMWLLRGGVLLSSLMSTLPAWRFVDPLPVLARLKDQSDDDEEDDDSLESLVGNSSRDELVDMAEDKHV